MQSKIVLHQGALKIEFFKRTKLLFNTGIRIETKYWNKKKQIILPHRNVDVDVLNSELHSKRSWIDGLLAKDLQTYGEIDVERVKALIKRKTGLVNTKNESDKEEAGSKKVLIAQLFQQFMDTHQSTWSKTLKKRYQNLGENVAQENVPIDEIDKMYLLRLTRRIEEGQLGQGINANTLKWRFKKFKSFYKWCVEKGLAQPNEYVNSVFKQIKGYDADFVTLSEERIQELFEYKSQYITYNKVRDTALILIFTGMRYSDFETLKRTDIVNGYIDKISIKTKIRFKVPLHPSIKSLVMDFHQPLPQQKFNYYFKKVGADLGWNEDLRMRIDFDRWETLPFHKWLSSHVGRHTAATRWLLQSIPTHIIKIWGGWKKESMINHYGEKIKLTTTPYMDRIEGYESNKRPKRNAKKKKDVFQK